MTIALVGAANYFSTSGDAFTSGPANTTGANFIIAALGCAAGLGTISDSNGNTWNPLTEYQVFFGTRAIRLVYAYNASVGTGHTFTVSGTSGLSPAIAMAWYSNVLSTSDPLDVGKVSGASDNGSATIAPGSLTPSLDECLVITGLFRDGNFSGGAPTINGGFTRETYTTDAGFGHFCVALGDLIQTTAVAANPTWTMASSDITASTMAVFKAGAPPPPPRDTSIRSRQTTRPGMFKPMGDALRTGKYRGWR